MITGFVLTGFFIQTILLRALQEFLKAVEAQTGRRHVNLRIFESL